jgi:hypothetical protein
MACKYCLEEDNHRKGCPEIVTEMSKGRAIDEFDAGSMSGAVGISLKENPNDSYRLGHEMGLKTFAENPANC